MGEAGFGLVQIGQVAINVKDVARATAFYRDVLGMRFLFSTGALAFFDCGGIRLMLGIAETKELDHPSSVLYYKVADLHAAHATLRERGVVFRDAPHLIAKMPDHDLWMTFFDDLDGNVLSLMSEVRP